MVNNTFAKAFNVILEQDAPTAPEAAGNVAPPSPQAGMEGEADALGASDIDPADAQILKHAAARELKMIESLNGWITELDKMVDYLNGTDANSIQIQLKKAVPDTIFDKMRTSEAKKIARVAKEISALAETFKGYAATADNPAYRFVAWFIGGVLPIAASLHSLV
jgi:hypothetical protein